MGFWRQTTGCSKCFLVLQLCACLRRSYRVCLWSKCHGVTATRHSDCYRWVAGTTEAGEWKDGKRNGQGTLTFANGCKYKGEWRDDKLTGQGNFSDLNGNKYVGEWKDNKQNGQGTLTLESGSVYAGEWKDGKQNGQGTYNYLGGATYVGEWKDGQKSGQGTYTDGSYANFNETAYVGEWKDGVRHGEGTFTHPRGRNKYVDKLNDSRQKGKGTYTDLTGATYVGEFKNDKRNGQGTLTYSDGAKYIGEFMNTFINGHGALTHADGGGYVGEWKNSMRNGQGVETQADGGVYVGAFKNNDYEGHGTLTHPNGTQEVGEFSEGVLINKMSFKENFSIEFIVSSTNDGFASKIEQIVAMPPEDVWNDLGLILHNRYMVKFLGGGNYTHTVFDPQEMLIARKVSAEINEQLQCHNVVMLKRLEKEPFMDLSHEVNVIADEVDDIVEAAVRQGPDHDWTPTTIGRFYLSKLTTHITELH